MAKRKATEFEQEVFGYLHALRESGVTNMFGAADYIKQEFDVEIGEARRVLALWMTNFNEEMDYEEIED